jgi:hypothetical protein
MELVCWHTTIATTSIDAAITAVENILVVLSKVFSIPICDEAEGNVLLHAILPRLP